MQNVICVPASFPEDLFISPETAEVLSAFKSETTYFDNRSGYTKNLPAIMTIAIKHPTPGEDGKVRVNSQQIGLIEPGHLKMGQFYISGSKLTCRKTPSKFVNGFGQKGIMETSVTLIRPDLMNSEVRFTFADYFTPEVTVAPLTVTRDASSVPTRTWIPQMNQFVKVESDDEVYIITDFDMYSEEFILEQADSARRNRRYGAGVRGDSARIQPITVPGGRLRPWTLKY